MFFSKIFQKFGEKHKGGPRQFFRVFKKISKITLIPCLFAPIGAKIFCWKTLIFKRKTLRKFRFLTKILLKSLSQCKNQRRRRIFFWKMLVYMLKMLRKWWTFGLRNVKFGAVLLKNRKIWTVLMKNFSRSKIQRRRRKFFW